MDMPQISKLILWNLVRWNKLIGASSLLTFSCVKLNRSRPGKLPRLSDFQDFVEVDFQPGPDDFDLPEGFGASRDLLHVSGASHRGQYPEGVQDLDSHTFGVLSYVRV